MSDEIKIPSLTLTTSIEELDGEETGGEMILLEKKETAIKPEELVALTEEEKKLVDDFAKQIDLTNNNMVLLYGAAAQKNIANFSDTALANIRTKDTGEIGQMLTNLVVELKTFNSEAPEEKGGIRGIFSKGKKNIDKIKSSYSKVETNVDSIAKSLKSHQTVLLKDVALLDKMYEMNKGYFKELSLYIAAGEQKLEETRAEVLPALQRRAQETKEAMDAQQVNDMLNMCDRFEKKLYDLKLTRQISLQMAPQIRMIQNNNTLLVEKIQTSIVNTIPLWKSQIVLALGISHSQNAMKAQREVTDLTNQMLKKNAETLKMGTIDVAKESERGIIDIETLKYTNQSLISTFDEVMKIQEDGRSKRKQAEAELKLIEAELKNKLTSLRG